VRAKATGSMLLLLLEMWFNWLIGEAQRARVTHESKTLEDTFITLMGKKSKW